MAVMAPAAEASKKQPRDWLDPVKEAKAVRVIVDSLRSVDPDDEVLLMDGIEGETRFLDIVDRLLLRMAETRGMIIGAEAVEGEIVERRLRFEKRLDADRALLEQAMVVADLPKLERPAATLSLSHRAPSLQVLTEADIPADYWKAGDPKLDRKALTAALKEGADIPGACLTNAAPTLTVRTK